jgi:hypothetical protein
MQLTCIKALAEFHNILVISFLSLIELYGPIV